MTLVLIGGLATAIFLCGALAQLAVGRLIERFPPHLLFGCVATIQFAGIVAAAYASGAALVAALAVAMGGIYAQTTVGDIMIARYTADAWRGRVYAVRYFSPSSPRGIAVQLIARLYNRAASTWCSSAIALTGFVIVVAVYAMAFVVNGAEHTHRSRSRRSRGTFAPSFRSRRRPEPKLSRPRLLRWRSLRIPGSRGIPETTRPSRRARTILHLRHEPWCGSAARPGVWHGRSRAVAEQAQRLAISTSASQFIERFLCLGLCQMACRRCARCLGSPLPPPTRPSSGVPNSADECSDMPASLSPAASWRLENPGRRERATARTSTRDGDLGVLSSAKNGLGGVGVLVADGEERISLGHSALQSFNRSISAMAPAGARTLPSWMTKANTSRGARRRRR